MLLLLTRESERELRVEIRYQPEVAPLPEEPPVVEPDPAAGDPVAVLVMSVIDDNGTATPPTIRLGEPDAGFSWTSLTVPVTFAPARFVPVTVSPMRPAACWLSTADDMVVIDCMFEIIDVCWRIWLGSVGLEGSWFSSSVASIWMKSDGVSELTLPVLDAAGALGAELRARVVGRRRGDVGGEIGCTQW